MAQQVTLDAASRTGSGKGAARSLRREGKIPGVIYGHHREPQALTVDAPSLSRMLGTMATASTLVDVAIDGAAPVKALIREIQRDPVRPGTVLHLDLYEVKADEAVTVSVTVHLVGVPDGVRNFGGVLDQVLYHLDVECLPGDIPERIDLDVTALAIGHAMFVRDVKVANATVLNDPDLPVCSVVAPRVEEAPVVAEGGAEPELIRKPKTDEDVEEKA